MIKKYRYEIKNKKEWSFEPQSKLIKEKKKAIDLKSTTNLITKIIKAKNKLKTSNHMSRTKSIGSCNILFCRWYTRFWLSFMYSSRSIVCIYDTICGHNSWYMLSFVRQAIKEYLKKKKTKKTSENMIKLDCDHSSRPWLIIKVVINFSIIKAMLIALGLSVKNLSML